MAPPIRIGRIAEAIGGDTRDDCRSPRARLLPHIVAQREKGGFAPPFFEALPAYTGMMATISQVRGSMIKSSLPTTIYLYPSYSGA